MKRNTRLFLLVGALGVVGLVVAAVNLTPDGASSQAAPADVLETVSGIRLEAAHAIVLVAASPTDKANVQAGSLATRLDAEGFTTTLLETPKLVRLKGGAVPGRKAVKDSCGRWLLISRRDSRGRSTARTSRRQAPQART